MCIIATTAISSIVAGTIGAFGIYNKVQTTNIQQAQAEYNTNLARQNAELARRSAAYERQEALEEARNTRIQNLNKVSALKTNIASGNIALNSQSASDIIDSTQLTGELDALNTLNQGEQNAQRYLLSAQNYDSKADLLISNTKTASKGNAASLLGSGLGIII